MAFIAAKCPECSGAIQLDDSKEAGFCMYCGTKVFLRESVSQRVNVDGIQTIEQKLKNAETFAKLGETSKAIAILNSVTEEYTSDFRAWWMLAKLKYAAAFYYGNHGQDYYGDITVHTGGQRDYSAEQELKSYYMCLQKYENKIEASMEYRYALQLATDTARKLIEHDYCNYKVTIDKNIAESDARITSTLNGDYTYLNHLSSFESGRPPVSGGASGFEVMDGNILYKWGMISYTNLSTLSIEPVDINSLNISIIDKDMILFRSNTHFSYLFTNEKTPDIFEQYLEYAEKRKKEEDLAANKRRLEQEKLGKKEQKQDKAFKWVSITAAVIFIALFIFMVTIN